MNQNESTLSIGNVTRTESVKDRSAEEASSDANPQSKGDRGPHDPPNVDSSAERSKVILNSTTIDSHLSEQRNKQQTITVGRFFSICFTGSIERGYFDSVNDVYIKYSIIAGPDWILSYGTTVGITQISRYRLDANGIKQFVWNQPITVSFKSYNYYGWPQIVVSVYNLDILGNDQILGYGCAHLPILNRAPVKQTIKVYSPQSTSYMKHFLSWVTGKKPELVDSNLFARGDCRGVLQTVTVGELELIFNVTSKDVANNAYRVD